MGFHNYYFLIILIFLKTFAYNIKNRLKINILKFSLSDSKHSDLIKALNNARNSTIQGLSPGADLLTADEQSDAAYADLINTSMDQRGIKELTDKDLIALELGGKMWEAESKSKTNKKGLIGDIFNVIKAVSGGAQILKNKYGET